MIDRLLYLKLCFNRAASHIGVLLSIIEKVILLGIWIAVLDLPFGWLPYAFGAVLVIAMLWAGHLDLKHRIMDREVSLANRYNPEIQTLIRKYRK